MFRHVYYGITISAFVISSPHIYGAATFLGVGNFPYVNPQGYATYVSADGNVVVGGSRARLSNPSMDTFRWTVAEGISGIGYLPNASILLENRATGISADGTVIVGITQTPTNQAAFRWTVSTGVVAIDVLPGLSPENMGGVATDVSADGSIIVGSSGGEAFRWTQSTGTQRLNLPVGYNARSVVAISADGSVMLCESATGYANYFLFSDNGVMELGDMPEGYNPVDLAGLSPDGKVIMIRGQYQNSYPEAFIWTQEEGYQKLGTLPGNQDSVAIAASEDGSSIIGYSIPVDSEQQSFLWRAGQGMRLLNDVFTQDFGLDISGWSGLAATDISSDGLTIVGAGVNPDGVREGWIATLPEPTTMALLSLCFPALLCRRI